MDHSASKPVSTLVGNCPSCNGYVRLPLEARPETNVRCPHCTKVFSVTAVLSQIPELEIVDEAKPESVTPLVDRQSVERPTLVERKKFDVPHQLVSGAKKRRKNRDSRNARFAGSPSPDLSTTQTSEIEDSAPHEDGSLVGEPDSLSVIIEPDAITDTSSARGRSSRRSPREMNAEHASRARVHSSQRHRRVKQEKHNASLEIVKVILGGLMAFPIAYLILLWGAGQDPLQLAPSLSKTIPFVVPKKMRTPARTPAVSESDKDNPRSELGANGKSGSRTGDNESSPLANPAASIDLVPKLEPENRLQSIPDVAPDKK